MKNILVFGQEEELCSLIREPLMRENLACAFVGKTGALFKKMSSSKEEKPEAIIIDLDLSDDISGWDICKILKGEKETKRIPVIMTSGKYTTPADIVFGFRLGIDDYVIKPFNPNVFVARLKAILRRNSFSSDLQRNTRHILLATKDRSIIVDLEKRTVNLYADGKHGITKFFTPKEFDLLCLFIKKNNQTLSREAIGEAIWGQSFFDTSRTIDKHIEKLRRKLGKLGKNIRSVSGIGYRFVA